MRVLSITANIRTSVRTINQVRFCQPVAFTSLVAFGKEEESPTQRYGRGFGVPLSDNEDSGT